MKRKSVVLVLLAVVVLLAIPFVHGKLAGLRVNVPEYRPPSKVVWLEQNWTDEQRIRFHHTSQGTRLVPYAWFMALEQPCLSPFGCEPFADPGYLGRFGFLTSPADPTLNPGGLPVGFAVDQDFVDPATKKSVPVVGLTCAACHTGELYHGDLAVRIDGAPAMIEVGEFQKALGLSLGFTRKLPFSLGRYGRFEERVLGPDATDEQKASLKADLDAFLAQGLAEKAVTDARHIYDEPAGFGRTDALTRIGNQVFAVDTGVDDNFFVSRAPVRFPQLWDASWLNWVQYNSSIADPLVRNIGESLGVRAALNLQGPDAAHFENSVDIEGLETLENLLAGPGPFEGLRSPAWPSVFPPLDPARVAAGAELYQQLCQGCHLPPIPELLADLQDARSEGREPTYWWTNALGNSFLKATDLPIEDIGTDPRAAEDFRARRADTGDLGLGVKTAAEGLEVVTLGIANKFLDERGFTPEERIAWSGGRDPKDPVVRDDLIYKARPLNGIWAVAPFLHNGSVPSLYLLLSPRADRPSAFWLGSKRFDTVNVGYENAELEGGSLYDTSRPGNSNSGHEFRDAPEGNGVIGPLLSHDERLAIIEYLKSL